MFESAESPVIGCSREVVVSEVKKAISILGENQLIDVHYLTMLLLLALGKMYMCQGPADIQM